MYGRILENPVESTVPNGSRPQSSLFGSTRLLGEKHGVDVGKDTTRGNGDVAEQLVELLIVLDGKSQVTGNDTALLVVASGVTGKLEDLGSEVLEDGGEVDASGLGDALAVSTGLEVATDTSNGELKASLGGSANGLSGPTSSLSLSFSCGLAGRIRSVLA